MFFRIAKKHQKLSSAILLAAFVFVVLAGSLGPIHQAKAKETNLGTAANVGIGAVLSPITIALYAIQYALGLVIKLEIQILSWVLSALSWNNSTVEDGWKIVRDVANLFFIIVIMIIAFATVLQLESYGMKKLLPKLILIALLINFSLVICGFLINFSDAFGNTFKDSFHGGANLAIGIASVLQVEKNVTQKDQTWWESVKKKISDIVDIFSLTAFFTLFLSILAQMIMVFTIGAGIFFMAIRQVALMMIVILSPMALVCLLLPFLNSYWNQWKEAFTKWAIFYPIYMFFLYVGLKILTSGAVITGTSLSATATGAADITSTQVLWKAFIASMFLCGAIVVAQKMSVAGAGAIASFGTKQLKDFTGVTRMGKAWEAAGKRREERREERRTLGLGARLRERLGTREMRERAILERKEAEKKRQENQDKLYGVKRGRKGEILKVEDETGLKKAANKKTIFGTVASARKSIAAKTLTKWEAQRVSQKVEKEEDLSSEAALASMGGGPKAK